MSKQAILIDAAKQEIRHISLSEEEVVDALGNGCEACALATKFHNGDTLLVDKDGLAKGAEDYFFYPELYPYPLPFSGLIVSVDEEGVLSDSVTDIEMLRSKIDFLSDFQVALGQKIA